MKHLRTKVLSIEITTWACTLQKTFKIVVCHLSCIGFEPNSTQSLIFVNTLVTVLANVASV